MTYQKWTSEPILVGEALEEVVDDLLDLMGADPIYRQTVRDLMADHIIQELI